MNRLIRYILLVTMILAFCASLYVLGNRVRLESANKSVEMALDFDSLLDLAQENGIPLDTLLNKMKTAGITTLAFPEMTLNQLQSRGRIKWMTGTELSALLKLTGGRECMKDLNLVPSSIYIINFEPALGKLILDNVNFLMGEKTASVVAIPSAPAGKATSENRIPAVEIKANPAVFPDKGIGFDEITTSAVADKGFLITLRPENREYMDEKAIIAFLERLGKIRGATCIVFGGENEVLGYPFKLDATLEGLEKSGLMLGDIEAPTVKTRQKGATYLGLKLPERVVRVQSISPQYLEKLRPESAIDMFRLGVRERNIRYLYMRPYPRSLDGSGIIDVNMTYFSNLKKEIESFRYETGKATTFPATAPPAWAVILICAGFWGILLLLLDELNIYKPIYAVILFFIIILFPSILIFAGKLHWIQKLMGLALGIAFPVYAMVSQFRAMDSMEKMSFRKALGKALLLFLKVSLITLLGCLLFSALFSSTTFMLGLDRVRGVKLILFLPPIICLLIHYFRKQGQFGRFLQLLKSPLFIWQVCVLGGFAILGLIYIMRSGNSADSLTTDNERTLRVALEQIFWVRPRFKDILVGHPAMIALWGAYGMKIMSGMGALVFLAGIGQADIMDTFAHVHTPLLISMVRVINGIIVGGILGIPAFYLWHRFIVLTEDFKSKNSLNSAEDPEK